MSKNKIGLLLVIITFFSLVLNITSVIALNDLNMVLNQVLNLL